MRDAKSSRDVVVNMRTRKRDDNAVGYVRRWFMMIMLIDKRATNSHYGRRRRTLVDVGASEHAADLPVPPAASHHLTSTRDQMAVAYPLFPHFHTRFPHLPRFYDGNMDVGASCLRTWRSWTCSAPVDTIPDCIY